VRHVMITPGHDHSRTNDSLSVPAGREHPGQKGSFRPLPCAYPGGETFMGARIPSGSLGAPPEQRDHHNGVMKGPAMSDLGKAHIVIMWTVGPDDVAAGDRLFESHGKWMTGHPREGDAAPAVLQHLQGPGAVESVDPNSDPTGDTIFVLDEFYESPVGVVEHWRQGVETWRCTAEPVVQALWHRPRPGGRHHPPGRPGGSAPRQAARRRSGRVSFFPPLLGVWHPGRIPCRRTPSRCGLTRISPPGTRRSWRLPARAVRRAAITSGQYTSTQAT
jgi:hypothetical protein